MPMWTQLRAPSHIPAGQGFTSRQSVTIPALARAVVELSEEFRSSSVFGTLSSCRE
ncbi:hypothetical protein [Olegusella massiliensis]|uniref:hypothetical protein n=1 Tax=Olegusella massiliensis TaxID=1776381 RepID=UPI000A835B9E|nr:hypothetical protein [Olegusella massiliensis]